MRTVKQMEDKQHVWHLFNFFFNDFVWWQFKHPIQTYLLDGNRFGLAVITPSFNLLRSHSEPMCWNPPDGSFLECSGPWSIWRAAHYISHLSLNNSLAERLGCLSAGSIMSLQTISDVLRYGVKSACVLLRRESGNIAAPRKRALCACVIPVVCVRAEKTHVECCHWHVLSN